MTELSVYPAAISTDESREACAYILWPQAVAVDAPAVARELEQTPDDLLVPLVLLHPAPHRTADPTPVEIRRLREQNPAAAAEASLWRWPASGLEQDEREMIWRLNALGALLICCSWQRPEEIDCSRERPDLLDRDRICCSWELYNSICSLAGG